MYIFNNTTLTFDKVSTYVKIKKNILFLLAFFILGIITGLFLPKAGQNVFPNTATFRSKHDIVIGSDEWKYELFTNYAKSANLYLSRPEFKNTPLTGEILSLAAFNAYDSTGILLPVELALAQCQWESGMGLRGRSPKNNPFNVGEYDTGTVLWFESTFDGVQAYYYLMCNNYLRCTPLTDLLKNFVNCNGNRYASGKYEPNISKQYKYIKKWIKRKSKTNS